MNQNVTLSPLEIVKLLAVRFPQVSFPPEFMSFLRAQEADNHQLHRVDSGETLVDFFRKQGVQPDALPPFLTEDSRLCARIDYQGLLNLTPEQAYSYLFDMYAGLFDLQQVALDSELPTGFNRHGREHASTVSRNAVAILREYDPFSAQGLPYALEAVIGGFLHDIGNLISRKYHGLYSMYLITLLFENFSADESTFSSFLRVLEIALFHEVGFGSQLSTLAPLNPPTLCVIIADKTDLGVTRVSSKSNVSDALDDVNVLINLLVANSIAQRLNDAKGRFRWTIDFKAMFDMPQHNLFSDLLKTSGRVKYPEEWRTLYEEGIEYLFVFNSTFLRAYLSRLYFAMHAIFALYPSIKEFQLVIDDAERGVSLMRSFTRDDYREKVSILGKLFYRQNWSDTYLYQALEQSAD